MVGDLTQSSLEVMRRTANWSGFTDISIEEARAQELRRFHELGGVVHAVHEVRELRIPVGDTYISCRLYRPHPDVGPGLIIWFHGGGWVVGSPATCDDQTRALAVASGCSVLSVDYRLAPEYPFPTPTEDCYAATVWAAEHTHELGVSELGRLAVGGESAGGNLAIAVTLMARDRRGPDLDLQMLIYPATCRELVTESRADYGDGYWLDLESLDWFWNNYVPCDEDGRHPYASPLLAASLAGLPPALIVLAQCDPLADDGRKFAERLRADGVEVEVRSVAGAIHGFASCAGVFPEAQVVFGCLGAAALAAFSS